MRSNFKSRDARSTEELAQISNLGFSFLLELWSRVNFQLPKPNEIFAVVVPLKITTELQLPQLILYTCGLVRQLAAAPRIEVSIKVQILHVYS